MKYKHLFFDLDHTLWDFEANSRSTLEELYHLFSLPLRGISEFEPFYQQYISHNEILWEKYRNGKMKVDELRWKRMWLTLLDFKITDEMLARALSYRFLEILPTRTELFPHAKEILGYLKEKNYQLHLLTNGFEETQRRKIRHAGIEHYFTHVITSEGSNSMKPQKEIFEYAFRKSGAMPEHSIMIGDTADVDILGAIQAGIDQVHVRHRASEPVQVLGRFPTYTVYSLKELENIF
ncbi:MAG: YjjG family noncanonical pyrimidine nucleotidase [Chitinophagaceae bacterium]|nr:YjjG family noncanonical pyrimidine nucleotidase [Chitinophagaceae bacterium]